VRSDGVRDHGHRGVHQEPRGQEGVEVGHQIVRSHAPPPHGLDILAGRLSRFAESMVSDPSESFRHLHCGVPQTKQLEGAQERLHPEVRHVGVALQNAPESKEARTVVVTRGAPIGR
jgi:hypothetical protein